MTDYTPATFLDEGPTVARSAVAAFVATIAVILVFFASTYAWCYFICRNYGGLRSCDVGWFSVKAICRR